MYKYTIKQCIADTLSQYEVNNDDEIITYSIDDQLHWEMLKLNIPGKKLYLSLPLQNVTEIRENKRLKINYQIYIKRI